MYHRRILCLVGVLLLALAAKAQDLRIATFNCEFLIKSRVHIKYHLPFDMAGISEADSIQWSDPAYRDAQFNRSCENVAAKIKEIKADIIGLTEVGSREDIAALQKALKKIGAEYPYFEVCKSGDVFTDQHVAVLSKYPLTDVVPAYTEKALYFSESDYDAVQEAEILKALRVTAKVEERDITLFVLHLKSERGGYESDALRLAQAEIARRWIIPELTQGKNVVVMGDFNSERRHPAILRLRGFDDIFPELIQAGDDKYFDDFTTRWTYNYRGNKEQIDHILLSMNLAGLCKTNDYKTGEFGIKTSIIPIEDDAVSDHNPLIVDLRFK